MIGKKTKLILLVIVVIGCVVIFNRIKDYIETEQRKKPIISDNKVISYQLAKKALESRDSKEIPKTEAADHAVPLKIGPDTLIYLRFLSNHFPECKEEACNIESARQYLFSNLSREQAENLFRIYKLFRSCETKVLEYDNNHPRPANVPEEIDRLRKKQELRREILGAEDADALYGPEVKMKEYKLRKDMIILNANQFGAEKEALLKQLDQDMWGGPAEDADNRIPFVKYQEQMMLYYRDLYEAENEDQRYEIKKQIREKCFDQATIDRIISVDTQLEELQEQKNRYEEEKQQIMSDPKLDENEKEQKIAELQNNTFSSEHVEKIRRKDRIQKALQDHTDSLLGKK